MKTVKLAMLIPLIVLVSACEENRVGPNKGLDRGYGKRDLSTLEAGIWVDPNGCDHWIIDDGVEGYLSARLDKFGKPVCSGIAPPTTATGGFKSGGQIGDSL